MNTTYRPFFVYGTLRPGQTNCEAILGPHLKEAIPARLSGYKMLLTPSYPMAIPSKEDQITGDVIYVSEANFDSLLADMDELGDIWATKIRTTCTPESSPTPPLARAKTQARRWTAICMWPPKTHWIKTLPTPKNLPAATG